MSRRRLSAVLALALLPGCFSYGAVHSYRTEEGRPIAGPGSGDAYLVWHDGAGWHLRARAVEGTVLEGLVESGRIGGVSPVGLAPEALRHTGERIAFSFVSPPSPGEVGFDWQGGCAEFSLFIGGDARPLRVFAGGFGASPPRVPFELCP